MGLNINHFISEDKHYVDEKTNVALALQQTSDPIDKSRVHVLSPEHGCSGETNL